MKVRTLFLVAIILVAAQIAAHAAPGLITYQGRLANASGQPITSTVNVTFTFWTTESGGTQIGTFSDTDSVTPDSNGVYSTLIGDDPDNLVSDSIFATDAVWLNVAVGSENLTPRKRLVSAPYALRAGQVANADLLDGQHATAFMAAGTDNWVNTTGDMMTSTLTIVGATATDLLSVANSGAGDFAVGVKGRATATGNNGNTGGYFEAMGNGGRGVRGKASASGSFTNYGGYFEAAGADGSAVYGSATGLGSAWGGEFHSVAASGRGVFGEATGASAQGVYGSATGASGQGVYGVGWGATGHGVHGIAIDRGAGPSYGGYFEASGSDARGVSAQASGASARAVEGKATAAGTVMNYGGYFEAAGRLGTAVKGAAIATGSGDAWGGEFYSRTDEGRGVYGYTTGATGKGVYGEARATTAGPSYGGYFTAVGSDGRGVYGYASGASGRGVYGQASSTAAGQNYGGYFTASGTDGTGVFGYAPSTAGGDSYGGYFLASSANGTGVLGQASGATGVAVRGSATNTGNYENYGGLFSSNGDQGYGAYGEANGDSGIGVYGVCRGSTDGDGGHFVTYANTGNAVYALAIASSGQNYAVYGHTNSASGYAAYFDGPSGSKNYFGTKVGIGRGPVTNMLEVGGEASKSTAGSWLANSDARIKTDVTTVTNALETLDKVRLVDFQYTDEYREAHSGVQDRRYVNVVAQEFAEVFPDYVKDSGEKTTSGDGILQVDTYPLTIYSAAAIQELHQIVQKKDTEIGELRQANQQLEQRLSRLEALVSAKASLGKP